MRGSLSVVDCYRAIVARISPSVVGDERRPAGPSRVLIVRISAQALIELMVLGKLVAVESHAQTRAIRHANRPAFVLHEAAFDDVVREVMIMGIGGERQV